MFNKLKFKLKLWMKTKKNLINRIVKLKDLNDTYNRNLLSQLEELDQNKVYICKMPGASQVDINNMMFSFKQVGVNLKWTMPRIIFLNQEIEEKKQESVK